MRSFQILICLLSNSSTFGGWIAANPPPILCMLAYELYVFNKKKGYEFIGVLPERRKNPMRITRDSVMNWGKSLLGDDVDSKNMFFKRVAIDSLSGGILWIDLALNNN